MLPAVFWITVMLQLLSPYSGESDKVVRCLARVLFVLCIEFLSRSIKNDPTIKGIQVNKHELKTSQYANDTTVFVRDLDSVTSLLRVLR